MDTAKLQAVQQSFGRCLLNKVNGAAFLDAFYDEFRASDPRIKAMFAKTDLRKQKELLREGLVKLMMFASGSGAARSSIEQLAARHDRQHLNVDPGMYHFWVSSLLSCVKKYDQKFDDALHKAWLEVLDAGLSVMKKAF